MSNCPCKESTAAVSRHVPNYALTGFHGQAAKTPRPPEMDGVLALNYSVCVGASLENNEVCFTLPIYGQYCINVPFPIPLNAQISACAETCNNGWGIPVGLRASLYLNNSPNPAYTVDLFGYC